MPERSDEDEAGTAEDGIPFDEGERDSDCCLKLHAAASLSDPLCSFMEPRTALPTGGWRVNRRVMRVRERGRFLGDSYR